MESIACPYSQKVVLISSEVHEPTVALGEWTGEIRSFLMYKGCMGKWQHRITNIDPEERIADCAECGPQTPIRRKGDRWRCSLGQRRWDKRTYRLLEPGQYQAMAEEQGGSCAICGSQEALCIDHDHQTNQVRGLLCPSCNKGLGFFKDSARHFQAAIRYLR